MIITDNNGEPMFVNILKLNVPLISSITRADDDEDTTLVNYIKGSQDGDKEFKLDSQGHATLIRFVDERHNRMRELGIIDDSVRMKERELGIRRQNPGDPATPLEDPNARSIKI